MVDLLQDLADRVRLLAGEWTKYTLVGGFLLYVAGYLALRFHLTAIGIGTDLTVVDERYLFTGARFLVYLVAAAPIALLILLPIAGAWKMFALNLKPTAWAWLGIVVSLVLIQFVMRQCFYLTNLLVGPELPSHPAWLSSLLLDPELMHLYYTLLLVLCAAPLALLVALRQHPVAPVARGLLAFLVAVQVLLLPVNYGVLILDKELPRVKAVGNTALTGGQDAWLVWEGNEGVTYLVRDRDRKERALVTVPKSDVKRTEIVAFDRIVPTLFMKTQGGR